MSTPEIPNQADETVIAGAEPNKTGPSTSSQPVMLGADTQTVVQQTEQNGFTVQAKGPLGVAVFGATSDNQISATLAAYTGEAGTGVRGSVGPGSGNPAATPTTGVWGDCQNGNGVYGSSATWNGVEGDSWAPAHAGVAGQNHSGGPGVWGSSTGNAGQFEGNVLVTGTVTVGGDVVLQNADCAEDFDVADCGITPGTVVIMTGEGSLRACDSEYATAVVGVISGAGSLRPAITLDRRSSSTPRMPVALMGKVYCKVDATPSPISVGDLLTTSNTPGHAMRVTDTGRAFGSVIGKALGGLAQGKGMIPVLVGLQ
jgi:hypothetical protein